MALTNAEKQKRWRERHQAVLTERAEDIAAKLMGMENKAKLRKVAALISDHLKNYPCEKCGGTGKYRKGAFACGHEKPSSVTARFPCPDCCPLEYFAASGGELRREGRYVEALCAAFDVMDNWAAGETLLAWGADVREVKAALLQRQVHIHMTQLIELRDMAKRFPPDQRIYSWELLLGFLKLPASALPRRRAQLAPGPAQS